MHSRFHCVNISKFAKKKNKTSYNDGLYPIGLLNSRNMKRTYETYMIGFRQRE